MCSQFDDPSMHDEDAYLDFTGEWTEAIEDSIDWTRLRQIHVEREQFATPFERSFGIPVREGIIRREADRVHHSAARRGAEYRQ